MSTCYLLLGTNLNDKAFNLEVAARKISSQIGGILTKSSIYLTGAWGKTEQDDFLNQVLCVSTEMPPTDVMRKCLEIESEMGRVREEKWGARMIDIDVLYYEDQIIDGVDCVIPHPEIQNRRFTLVPLAEIAPDGLHPKLKKTNFELLSECRDSLEVKKIK